MNSTRKNLTIFYSRHFERFVTGFFLTVVFLILLIPLIGPLTIGHDLNFHLYRIQGIHDGLASGVFPVRLNSAYMNGYGYPVGICYGDFYLYIPAIIEFFGFSLVKSYKLFVVLFNLLSILVSFTSFKKISGSTFISLAGCCIWILSPYRLECVYLRAAVGEYLAQAFLPLLASSALEIFDFVPSRNKLFPILLLAFSVFSIVVSHILSLLIFLISFSPIIIYCLITSKNKKCILYFSLSITFGFFLASYFIIPFLDMYKNGNLLVTGQNDADKAEFAANHATYLPQLFQFFPRLSGGSFAGVPTSDEIPQTLGFAGIISLFFIVIIFKKEHGRNPKIIISIFISILISLILSTNCFPWWKYNDMVFGKLIVLISTIQFPWRFIGCLSFLVALLFCVCFALYRKKHLFTLFALIIIPISVFCGLSSLFTVRSDNGLVSFTSISDCPDKFGFMSGEYLPRDINFKNGNISDFSGKPVVQNCHISDFSPSNRELSFVIDAHRGSSAILPRLYYPFYSIDSNSQVKAVLSDQDGLLNIKFIDKYCGKLSIKFVYPKSWIYADHLSLVSFSCWIVCLTIVCIRSFVKLNQHLS